MMRKARFKVSHGLLASLLKLPKNADILYVVQRVEDISYGRFDIYVTHPDLPNVPEGMEAAECDPIFNDDGFIDWGL